MSSVTTSPMVSSINSVPVTAETYDPEFALFKVISNGYLEASPYNVNYYNYYKKRVNEGEFNGLSVSERINNFINQYRDVSTPEGIPLVHIMKNTMKIMNMTFIDAVMPLYYNWLATEGPSETDMGHWFNIQEFLTAHKTVLA